MLAANLAFELFLIAGKFVEQQVQDFFFRRIDIVLGKNFVGLRHQRIEFLRHDALFATERHGILQILLSSFRRKYSTAASEPKRRDDRLFDLPRQSKVDVAVQIFVQESL